MQPVLLAPGQDEAACAIFGRLAAPVTRFTTPQPSAPDRDVRPVGICCGDYHIAHQSDAQLCPFSTENAGTRWRPIRACFD
jgi:hypothetical protein